MSGLFSGVSNFVRLTGNQIINGIKTFSQNLGLGISNPQAKLHIDGGEATASTIKFTAGTTTGQTATDGFDIGIAFNGIASINQRLNSSLNLATNGNNRVLISGGGIVTISSTQASTASNNGALVLSNGGLGVNGAINAGGALATSSFATIGSISNINFTQLGIVTGASRVGLAVRGNASQTNNLQDWRNSSDAVLASVSATGIITAPQFRLSANNTVPASATDTGTLGEIRVDANFIYYCVSANTWKRTALSTW